MYKLLIADDESEIRNGLRNYFPWNEIGFEVVCEAENGKEVLQVLTKQSIDVILCDIRMPIMTGIDVARELFNQQSPIKIIFLSGYKEFTYAQQALNFGVKNYILKPTKYSELVEVFEKIKEELDQEITTINADSMLVPDPMKEDKEHSLVPGRVIATIKQYVRENYKDANLEEASKMVYMNPHYISKYFKEKTGENFSDFVISVKMNKAAELLHDDRNYKVYEISEFIGYSNAKNFTRTFRKYFGKSPREYMQEYK